MAILSETIAIPFWATATAAVAIVVLTVIIHQLEMRRRVAAVIGIVALLAAFSFAISPMLQPGAGPSVRHEVAGNAVERRALETRRADLTARATMPGSPLACLNALASEPVETACKQAVFANPTSAAVAVSYAAAQLRLLADGVDFARRTDSSYAAKLTDLRLAVENDAYGVYAHVLATHDRCTAEQCAAFALLHDPSTLKVHLRQRLYVTSLAEHRDRWGLAAAAAAVAPLAVAPVSPAPAEIPAAAVTTAVIPAAPSAAATPAPLPKARPAPTVAAKTETSAAVTVRTEEPPAVAEVPPAAPASSPRFVPPVASVLPNIDFPSASSIPAINIMAAEPKLPPTETAPAASSTAPRSPSRPQ